MNFCAVILAHGKSPRMSRNEAWLEVGGHPPLKRQIQPARDLSATVVFISGRVDADHAAFGNCMPCLAYGNPPAELPCTT